MSKIQKALGRLRSDDRKPETQVYGPTDRGVGTEEKSTPKGNGHDSRHAMRRRKRYAIPDIIIDNYDQIDIGQPRCADTAH